MLLSLLLLSCQSGPAVDSAASAVDTEPFDARYRTVLLVTADTTNERFLGRNQPLWDTTPNLDALMADGVWLEDVYTVKGSTVVSLPTLLTGTWPRTHGIRGYEEFLPPPVQPMLQDRFQSVGYRTMGFSSNFCEPFLDRGMDLALCTWRRGDAGASLEKDTELVDAVVEALGSAPADELLYIWLHVVDPHSPYEAREPWYSELEAEAYEGEVDLSDESQLNAVCLGEVELDEALQGELDRVYASQVASVDAYLGRVVEALEASGRLDEALIAFGTDHGEELGAHHNFLFHACSPYDPVLNTTWALRAPLSELEPGRAVTVPLSITDLAPTLLDLAGLGVSPVMEGRSIAADLLPGAEVVGRPVFFERSAAAAGVVTEGHKLFINPQGDYKGCLPYIDTPDEAYPGQLYELYDLEADPGELVELSETDPARRAALEQVICDWVAEEQWTQNEAANVMVRHCTALPE